MKVGTILDYTPRFKVVGPCKTDTPDAKFNHLHAEDGDGNFTVCTATYDYQQMAGQAAYEAEHDL
jgi:hypothetical protein